MLGLYLHIPFCARRCPYCDFAVHVGNSLHGKYLRALQSELRQVLGAHFEAFPDDTIGTIFCGGGTPTSVGAEGLNPLLQIVRGHARLAPNAEVTLEANPEDASPALFESLRAGGWSRVSFGVQSLDDGVLQVLGRRHGRAQAEQAVALARAAGFENINLDLIYAVPGQTPASWRETLGRALELEVPHLSCYSLTIEEGTAFGRRAAKGRLREVGDGEQAAAMEEAQQVLLAGGLSRYEISNYARAGFECRHNVATWRGGSYLAAGNGAHGHLAGRRWWNVRGVPDYIARVEARESAREDEEYLTPRQRLDEIVMLGLRLREGFDLTQAGRMGGSNAEREIGRGLSRAAARGDVERGALEMGADGAHYWKQDANGSRFRVAPSKWALADAVALDVLI